jgi:hypothetical protein
MNGKNYYKRKEESMPITQPETQENERATSKCHEYTETKVSSYIAVAFVTKKSFSLPTSHVFFWRLYIYENVCHYVLSANNIALCLG